MRVPSYVYKKLTLFEKIKLKIYNMKYNYMLDRMDHHIIKSRDYEDLMYEKDAKLENYANKLIIKYS